MPPTVSPAPDRRRSPDHKATVIAVVMGLALTLSGLEGARAALVGGLAIAGFGVWGGSALLRRRRRRP